MSDRDHLEPGAEVPDSGRSGLGIATSKAPSAIPVDRLAERRRKPRWPWLLIAPAIIYLVLTFLVPNLLIFVTSVFHFESNQFVPGFTLEHYGRFLGDSYYLRILYMTVGLGVAVGLSTVVAGYPLAYFLTRSTSVWRKPLLAITLLPLIVSVVVRTYGWIVMLDSNGIINQTLLLLGIIEWPLQMMHRYGAVYIGLTYVLLPYSVLSIMTALQAVDPRLEQASMDLGAGRFRTFHRITLPLILPGILTGFVLTFAITVSAYATPRVLGGRPGQTMATLMYDFMIFLLHWPFASTIAVISLVTAASVLAIVLKIAARRTVAT